MLFEVIQESVDMVYFLEEDTIACANTLLDKVILDEMRLIVEESITELRGGDRQQIANQQASDNKAKVSIARL